MGRSFGASLNVITSYRWSFGAIHWDEWFEYNRERHPDLFSGVILEGPHDWAVRPVSEIFYDKDFDGEATASLLVGAIWQVRDSLAFDAGLRGARVGDGYVGETRLGLTWSVPFAASCASPLPLPLAARYSRSVAAARSARGEGVTP